MNSVWPQTLTPDVTISVKYKFAYFQYLDIVMDHKKPCNILLQCVLG